MNMEQMGGYEDRNVALGNQMQMQLAEKHGEQLGDFIELHAEQFREIVTANPHFLEEYSHAPDSALEKVEKIIYH